MNSRTGKTFEQGEDFKMKNTRRILFIGLNLIFFVALLSGAGISEENVTIIGTVNNEYQIVTDDDMVYEVAETEKGDEVVDLVGKKVKVMGTVEESEGTKIITVTSYEVVGE